MSNESRCGLYIDLLMTVRYSHEAWEGHVCSANSHEAWKGCVCSAHSHEAWKGRVCSANSHEAWKGRVCSWRTDTVAFAGEDASVQRFQGVMFGGNF